MTFSGSYYPGRNYGLNETMHCDVDSMTKLIEIKSKLEEQNSDLMNKKDEYTTRLANIKSEKDEKRNSINNLMITKLDLRADVEMTKTKVDMHKQYHGSVSNIINNFDTHIEEQINLNTFEEQVKEMIQSIMSAINHYQGESLQLELMRRNQVVQSKRVELTSLETKLGDLEKKIEAKRQEEEMAKKAEEERIKREEEAKREYEMAQARLELRRIQEEEAKRAEQQARHDSHQPKQHASMKPSFQDKQSNLSSVTDSIGAPMDTSEHPLTAKNSTPKEKTLPSFQDTFKDWTGLLSW